MAGGQSFEERFDELWAIAYRVAYRVLGSRPEAEDAAQEALVRTCLKWRRAEGHAEPWVATVASRVAIDAWRRRQRRPSESGAALVGDGLALVEDRVQLNEALRSLPRRQREVVVLRYLADLPEATVAAALGCTAGTVKQHASRGLAGLRRQLEPVGEP